MGTPFDPRYVPPPFGWMPPNPLLVVIEPPPLPWSARHPHLAALIASAFAVGLLAVLRLL